MKSLIISLMLLFGCVHSEGVSDEPPICWRGLLYRVVGAVVILELDEDGKPKECGKDSMMTMLKTLAKEL